MGKQKGEEKKDGMGRGGKTRGGGEGYLGKIKIKIKTKKRRWEDYYGEVGKTKALMFCSMNCNIQACSPIPRSFGPNMGSLIMDGKQTGQVNFELDENRLIKNKSSFHWKMGYWVRFFFFLFWKITRMEQIATSIWGQWTVIHD